jgi:hypothetical protein
MFDHRPPSDPTAGPGPATPKKKMSRRRKVGIGAAVFVVLGVIGSLTNQDKKDSVATTAAAKTETSTTTASTAHATGSVVSTQPVPATTPTTAAPTTTTTTVAPTTTTTAAPTTTTTRAPTATVVFQRSGSGIGSTPTFTVPDEWQLVWSYNCASFGSRGNFVVDATGGPDTALVNDLGSGRSSTEYEHSGGPVSLSINSECAWTITVKG